MLAEYFAAKFAKAGRTGHVQSCILNFWLVCKQHPWPGNARELSNFMRRVVAMSADCNIGPEQLDGGVFKATGGSGASRCRAVLQAGTPIRELERQLLETTLQLTGGNRTRAAEMLGISLRTIRNKIREFGLPPRRFA